jgi:glucose/arabinose dehydrogenase
MYSYFKAVISKKGALTRFVLLTLFSLSLTAQITLANPETDSGPSPEVATGFTLSQWAKVPNARQMALSENGTLFVGSRQAGQVHAVLPDGEVKRLASGLTMPSGLALNAQGDLYIAAVNGLYRLKNAQTQVKKENVRLELLNDDLPSATHHGWKFIDFDPVTQELVVPVGAPCNVCLVYPQSGKEPYGTILALNTQALNKGELSYRILAQGVRNSVGFAWHPKSQELWFTDNGRDHLGDDLPPCEVNRIAKVGEHYGFPFRHGEIPEPDSEILAKQPDPFVYRAPVIAIQAHSAPLGMAFYQGDLPDSLPTLNGAMLVAEHGSWNRSSPVGYRLSAYWLENEKVLKHEVLVNWLVKGKKLGRPVDVLTYHDGSLLISDDAKGVIWQLSAD